MTPDQTKFLLPLYSPMLPYKWQARLFDTFRGKAKLPNSIFGGTGCGKTIGVLAAWLAANATLLARGLSPLAHRLVWCVNSRSITDQIFQDALDLAEAVTKSTVLSSLLGDIRCCRLRGGKAVDSEWRDYPEAFTIIVGTVDMLGSRLLVNGYGVGRSSVSQEAGLLGCDALWVLDEPHMAGPFEDVLRAASKMSPNGQEGAMRVITLGATQHGKLDGFSFNSKETAELVAAKKIGQCKIVREAKGNIKKNLASWTAALMKDKQSQQGIVVCSTISEAKACYDSLRNAKNIGDAEIYYLSGAMRPADRDGFDFSLFKRIPVGGTKRILVTTSAIEAGVNISGKRMLTDKTTLFSLAQRLGRANRFGEYEEAFITVCCGEEPVRAVMSAKKYLAGMEANTPQVARGVFTRDTAIVLHANSPRFLSHPSINDGAPFTGWYPDLSKILHGSVSDEHGVFLLWRTGLKGETQADVARIMAALPPRQEEMARCAPADAKALFAAWREQGGVYSVPDFRQVDLEEAKDSWLGGKVFLVDAEFGGYLDGFVQQSETPVPAVAIAENKREFYIDDGFLVGELTGFQTRAGSPEWNVAMKQIRQLGLRPHREFAQATTGQGRIVLCRATAMRNGGSVTLAAHREDARNEIVEILRGLTFLEDGVRDDLIDAAWKNLVGAFHQPKLVIADTSTLDTLPTREFNSGLAETVKNAIISSPDLLDFLESYHHAGLGGFIAKNAGVKARIVSADEFETTGSRVLLNFGHTIGHGIEQAAGYGTYLHGEAVSLGMVAALFLSVKHAGFRQEDADRIAAVLAKYKQPLTLPDTISTDDVMAAVGCDKKHENGKLQFVLSRGLGSAFVSTALAETDIREAIDALRN